MTLSSSTSRQQRKSMLPKPRPSVRISSSRRVLASSDHTTNTNTTTSRIARRVPSPSPLLAVAAMSCNDDNDNGFVKARPAEDSYNLTPPEFGPRRAGSQASRIPPWSAGLATLSSSSSSSSRPTPGKRQSEDASSLSFTSTGSPPSPGDVDVNVQYRTQAPLASTEIKHERGRDPAAVTAVVPPARYPSRSRRPASLAASTKTALTLTNNFLRVHNGSPPRDSDGLPTLTWKKLAFTDSVRDGGKENRRPPRIHARVPPPPIVPTSTIPPRSIRRTVVAQSTRTSTFRGTSSHETSRSSPRPLVIRKQQPLVAAGCSSQVRSPASGASGALPVALDSVPVPAGIQALIEDIDRFAKEWTAMFDELSVVAGDHPEGGRLSKLDAAYVRSRPTTGRPEDAGHRQADSPAAGKGTPKRLPLVSSGSASSVSTLQASTVGETAHFDVTSASLARWQHRNKAMAKEDKLERDLPEAASTSATDPPTDGAHYLQRAVLRNASFPVTSQASRHLPSLPEIDQPPIISGSHLVEKTNRKVELANLPEPPSTEPRRIDAARHYGITRHARYYPPATVLVPKVVSSSPPSIFASLSPVSGPYSSSPWVNLRADDFAAAQRTLLNAAGDTVPARASSLRGLRAIFKRTSAGLTGAGGHRQRAESLKELIGEPRVLSLGSVSISSLRDTGFAGGCAQPRGQEINTMMTTGDLARIMTTAKVTGAE